MLKTYTYAKRSKQMNRYYNTCPDCGAALDPGERCDCRDNKVVKLKPKTKLYHKPVSQNRRIVKAQVGGNR